MSRNAKIDLDPIDLRILRELQAEGRLPNIVLAERVGLSPSPCARRVRMLEEAGVLQGCRVLVDRAAVGLPVTVFAGIKVERHSRDNADAFIAAVQLMPEVVGCHLVSGDVDFLLEVVVRDIATYEAEVLRSLLALPSVRDIRTSFAMKSYKTSGPLPI
jgi:Lrp/AsnC family leucine-responsive transcriptional regulator